MPMSPRRPFDRAAFLASYRAACIADGRDPATGEKPVFTWPAERQQPYGRPWWCSPDLWQDSGVAHSSTEREAVSALAASTRAMTGTPRPDTLAEAMDREFRAIVRDALAEDKALVPLREKLAAQGKTVETDKYGIRREVAIGAVA